MDRKIYPMSQHTKTTKLRPRLRPRKTVPQSMNISVKGATGFATVKQVRAGKKVAGLEIDRTPNGEIVKLWSQSKNVGSPTPVLVITNLPPDHPLAGVDGLAEADKASP